MPSYIVQGTHIWHGTKGAKQAICYGPGDAIELTPSEAAALGGSVKPAGGPTAAQDGASSGDGSLAGSGGEGGPGAGSKAKGGKNKGGE